MSDTDLFTTPKEEGTPEGTPAEAGNNESTYLGMILNEEGKPKYANTEEALKGAVHAQGHITNLEQELKELREQVGKGADMKDILDAMNNRGQEQPIPQELAAPQDSLEDVVNTLLTQRENVQTANSNVQTVVNVFKEKYGEKASETLYNKAATLGLSKDEINSIISSNPTAALNMLGVTTTPTPSSDPAISGGNVNAENFQEQGEEKLTSSMGYLKTGELENNWEASQEATLKRLGVEITT